MSDRDEDDVEELEEREDEGEDDHEGDDHDGDDEGDEGAESADDGAAESAPTPRSLLEIAQQDRDPSLIAPNRGGRPRKKRGRPFGSKNKKGSMMLGNAAKPPRTLHDGVPIDQLAQRLNELGPDQRFPVRLQRKNDANGQLQSFPRIDRSIPELFDIETHLDQLAGGGLWYVEVRNPASMDQLIVPRFTVYIAGPPRQPRFAGTVADHAYQASQPGPVVQGFPSPWAQNLPPAQQQQYHGGASPGPIGQPPPTYGPGATIASDRLAMHQNETLRAEIAELRSENRAAKEKYEDRVTQLEKDLLRERETAKEAMHKAEMARLEAKLEALSTARPEPKSGGTVEIVAALAPVLGTLFTSRDNASMKSMEIASQNLNNMMSATLAQANKPDQMITVVLPLIKEMMMARRGDPKSEIEFLDRMMQSNLNNVSMMAQLVEAMTGSDGEKPWWSDVVTNALEGGKSMVAAYMEHIAEQRRGNAAPAMLPSGAGLPTNLPRRQMAAKPQPHPQPQVAQQQQSAPMPLEYSTEGADDGVLAPDQVEPAVAPTPSNGALTGREKVLLGALPADFQTPPWRKIIIALHRETPLEQLTDMIVMHLESCIQFEMLPSLLADLQDDPASALGRVIAPLPFAQQQPDKARDLLKLVITALARDGWLNTSPPMAEVIKQDDEEQQGDYDDAGEEPLRAAQ